ncbi:Holliday junction resolvase RuvX [Maribacter cobaltidurans]|uniref:Putative pre-16S rRNA nuclease n=1 Tax=Maribacter cobaltidurans TaxID=1178778 RepID=A0A223V2K0_9FLAO|nr:Holliday junction resolvase RuvX [Maribacter cobaltidurans]ASV29079.1 Holliday junction resolvase RuvX [Maribacter cobaltidurans]GGD72101.1 putative pre-16S rRNA nuclease [Maribacter cobaltidurans]
MGRILALDYGQKRTGVAVTDELRIIASGLTTVPTNDLIPFLTQYLEEESVDVLVVGEPKQMNNQPSESEVYITPFLKQLSVSFPNLKVVRQDERFTSKMAFQSMLDGGLKKKQRRNKELIDEISATLILQDYLKRI